MVCGYCKRTHGCGCMARRASDGQVGCSSCIAQLEVQIAEKKKQQAEQLRIQQEQQKK